MSREILFRGKDVNTDEWVYGSCLFGVNYFGENEVYIYPKTVTIDSRGCTENYAGLLVDSETVGQWTGLVDKNGNGVFEGDILSIEGSKEKYDVCMEVVFKDFQWKCIVRNRKSFMSYFHRLENNPDKYEIIGNIWDNPELLKEREE